ncbi:MAG: VacJ family lipoprotein [Holosporaceae bacterium]|jgi:phospholipid-binding lipoprotein MlaA|nr:VacJ family lipoprotein [Holosporaceae bacterium]
MLGDRRVTLAILFFLTSCSSSPDNPDPYEEFNRDMHELNMAIDENILEPVASTYNEVAADPVKESVSNFFMNLKEPFYCINYAATLDAEYAANSLFRFFINSIFGAFGLFDVAEQIGLEKAETSHRDTLKKLDVPTGDYLVLPVLGFSSTRDAIAEPISWFADPVGYFIGFPYMIAKAVLSTISDRAENSGAIDDVKENSFDLYSTTKSIYLQKYGNEEDSIDEANADEQP